MEVRKGIMSPHSAELYMRTLGGLNNEVKLELISMLSLSMTNGKKPTTEMPDKVDLYHVFHGDWGNDILT